MAMAVECERAFGTWSGRKVLDPTYGSYGFKKWTYVVVIAALGFLCLGECVRADDTTQADLETPPLASSPKEKGFFDVCRHSADDYERIRSDFAEAYTPGSDATELIAALNARFDLQYNGPSFDLTKIEGRLDPTDKRFTAWLFEKTCHVGEENRNRWQILLLGDNEKRLTGSELRLFFDDNNFASRNRPFNFDHFRVRRRDGRKPAEKALWSLTGRGTRKASVHELMVNAVDGEYGELNRIPTYATGRRDTIIYWYRPHGDKHLSARMGAPFYRWRIFWTFDENERLIKLVVE